MLSASLASSAKRQAAKILEAGHDDAAVRNAATPSWPLDEATATEVVPLLVGRVIDPPLPGSHCANARWSLYAAVQSGVVPPLAGWVTDPPLPASHCANSRWPSCAAA